MKMDTVTGMYSLTFPASNTWITDHIGSEITLELVNMNMKDMKNVKMKDFLYPLYTNHVHYMFRVLRLGAPVLSTDVAFGFTFNNDKLQLSLEKLDVKVKDDDVMKKIVEVFFLGINYHDSLLINFNQVSKKIF